MAKRKALKLTPKQKRFAQEYLIDLNATQAVIRAGYSKKTANSASHRLLLNVGIQAEIQKGCNKREKRTEVTQDRVITELARIAFANITDVVSVRSAEDAESGCTTLFVDVVPSDQWTPEQAAAIAEVSESNQAGGFRTIKLKMNSKIKALEMLGRHLGIFNDKLEVSGELTFADLWKMAKGDAKTAKE